MVIEQATPHPLIDSPEVDPWAEIDTDGMREMIVNESEGGKNERRNQDH